MTWLARLCLSASLLFGTACGPLINVCHVCLKGDPQRPVAAGDLRKVKLAVVGTALPAVATNVYYHEECGIDCRQWLRFDLPRRDAPAFIERLATKRSDLNDGAAHLAGPEDPVLLWWPKDFPADTIVSTTPFTGLGDIGIAAIGRGNTTRLWVAVVEL